MQEQRASGNDGFGMSPIVARTIQVLVIVVLVVLLYVIVSGIIRAPTRSDAVDVTITQDGTNWSAAITALPSQKLPTELYLLARDPGGTIVLPRTSFANLSADRWAVTRAAYEDGNPVVPEVRVGDRLLLDRGTYPAGSTVEVSDIWSVLMIRTLR